MNGIRYAFVDFETEVATKKAFSSIPNQFWFGMSTPLQVRYRFDKTSLPSFDAPIRRPSNDSSSSDLDYRTIHVSNLPHNINKPEIESVLSKIGHIHRIKIFQRAVEKKSSVFVTFKSTEKAKSARLFLETHKLPFKEMKESLEVEYPAQDISRNPPSFTLPGQTGGPLTLSKKARKLLAAENRIVYVRSLEPLDYATLKAGLEIIGPCEVYITKVDSPSTAFVEFATPGYCSTALAEKAMGATLPRHKRVDFPNDPNYTEVDLKEFLSSIADIKTVSEPTAEVTTVEFITALGAAKAIVHCRSVAFKGVKILADYTPSVKPEDGIDESVASQEGLDDKLCKDDKYDVDSETISLEVLEKPLKELDIGAPPLEEIIAMDVISLESLTHEIIESNGQDDMEDNGVISLSDLQSQI
ncbi:hypothetical protein BC833DRAFT_60293 [Globomyces pollinis-pini]|nr:hypothetical protein BC833DRAFT_60293 [Globomyces pollinis-pini]